MKYSLHPRATEEYEAAAEYYERCEEDLGFEFADAVEQHLIQLGETASLWPLWPKVPASLRVQRYRMHRFPFSNAYRVEGDELRIYAIAHNKQKPGYWVERIE